jgi:hypothetical protein
MDVSPEWTVRHFTQANPRGAGQGDVRALLERIGATLDSLGPVEVQDMTFHTEVTEDGPWHSITVYYHPLADART